MCICCWLGSVSGDGVAGKLLAAAGKGQRAHSPSLRPGWATTAIQTQAEVGKV